MSLRLLFKFHNALKKKKSKENYLWKKSTFVPLIDFNMLLHFFWATFFFLFFIKKKNIFICFFPKRSLNKTMTWLQVWLTFWFSFTQTSIILVHKNKNQPLLVIFNVTSSQNTERVTWLQYYNNTETWLP